MIVLSTAAEVNQQLIRLIGECSSCQIAVAWASTGFEAFDLLSKHRKKIEKMVVGTHFYQTHPDFIETFRTEPNVQFVTDTSGVFHPKTYLFEMATGPWECLLGSPNFTSSAVSKNDEMAVLISNEDHQSHDAVAKMKAAISGYWKHSRPFTAADLEEYRKAWESKRPTLDDLQERVNLPISADELMEFANTLNYQAMPTLASADRREKTLFRIVVYGGGSGGIEFIPVSSDKHYPVSRGKLQEFCQEYHRLGGSKNTANYTSISGVSSYLLAIIDLFEKRGEGRTDST